MKQIDLSGRTFERLKVLEIDHKAKGETFYKCECRCGNSCIVRGKCLASGKTKSCGCLRRDHIQKVAKERWSARFKEMHKYTLVISYMGTLAKAQECNTYSSARKIYRRCERENLACRVYKDGVKMTFSESNSLFAGTQWLANAFSA